MALAALRMQAWPYPGRVGVREHDPASGRTDVHVFDQWCHLATVQDTEALHEALDTRGALAFDLDTYRLLVKRLATRPGADGGLMHFA